MRASGWFFICDPQCPPQPYFKPTTVALPVPFPRHLSGKPAVGDPKIRIERNANQRRFGSVNLSPTFLLPPVAQPCAAHTPPFHSWFQHATPSLMPTPVAVSGTGIFVKEGRIINQFIPTSRLCIFGEDQIAVKASTLHLRKVLKTSPHS